MESEKKKKKKRERRHFIPIWKVSYNNPTLFDDLSIINDHIFAY